MARRATSVSSSTSTEHARSGIPDEGGRGVTRHHAEHHGRRPQNT